MYLSGHQMLNTNYSANLQPENRATFNENILTTLNISNYKNQINKKHLILNLNAIEGYNMKPYFDN